MEDFSQAKNLIEGAQSILILPPQKIDGDTLASSLALFSTLKKLGKNVNALINEVPEKFKFLNGYQPETSGDFVISVNTADKEISKMHYERNNGDLRIYLTLNKGELRARDVSFPSITHPANILFLIFIKSLTEVEKFF